MFLPFAEEKSGQGMTLTRSINHYHAGDQQFLRAVKAKTMTMVFAFTAPYGRSHGQSVTVIS